ncbi:EH domain-containing protein 3-like isoform X2 [Clavelina lepadiformis]|uniref:EH domain-containing protein 3-like isoform X2 n=1 Tax=Clavelina lepadiformis TaxID=159417 RepID=UPI0040423E46
MLRWIRGEEKEREPEIFESVSLGLKKLYRNRLKPLEEAYKFHDFHSPPLDNADFDAKPMILLIGQYSTGKTTFIRYLLEKDFPGMRIGPEPTTDCFIAIMAGDKDKSSGVVNEGIVPGNAAVVDDTKPFRALSSFGNAFLSRFQCSHMENEVLNSISIIDTPGILSGEKQRVNRGYDFAKVLTWLAERVDRIILLFDAHKLDISDEFHEALNAVKTYDSKIRVVLNKSDQVNTQQLMRVYGALMWSLGKVITTPEVVRVYIGSFWDQPLRYDENRLLFEAERNDLFEDIQSLPRNAALRKLNDLIKRARLAKVHAYIISYLHDSMPSVFGKEKAKNKLINDLEKIYGELANKYNISLGDFPNVQKMKERLKITDFSKLRGLSESMIRKVDDMLSRDIAELMKLIQREETKSAERFRAEGPAVKGGVFSSVAYSTSSGGAFSAAKDNPFSNAFGVGVNAGSDFDGEWIVSDKKPEYDEMFMKLNPTNGKVKGSEAKKEMVKSKLPNTALAKVWRLADHDKDGMLTEEEFALAMHLINVRLEGHSLPDDLPVHLVPPSQRRMAEVN